MLPSGNVTNRIQNDRNNSNQYRFELSEQLFRRARTLPSVTGKTSVKERLPSGRGIRQMLGQRRETAGNYGPTPTLDAPDGKGKRTG